MEVTARLVDDVGYALKDLQTIIAIPVKEDVELCYEDASTLAFIRTVERFQVLVKALAGQEDRLEQKDILKVFGGLVDQEQARLMVGMFGALGNLSIDREWYPPEERIHYDKYTTVIPEYAKDLEALLSYIKTHVTLTDKEPTHEVH